VEECVSCCGDDGRGGGTRLLRVVPLINTVEVFSSAYSFGLGFALLRSYDGTCGDLDYTVWLERAEDTLVTDIPCITIAVGFRFSKAQRDKKHISRIKHGNKRFPCSIMPCPHWLGLRGSHCGLKTRLLRCYEHFKFS